MIENVTRPQNAVRVSPYWGGDSPMCQGGYKIPGRTKGVIWSSQGRRPSLFLLNKIHQDSVSLSEYITFAKITGEREISLQTVTPAFKAIWEEVQTLTTDGISNDGLFRSLSHPFTYQSFCTSLCSLTASTHWLETVKLLDLYFHWSGLQKYCIWWIFLSQQMEIFLYSNLWNDCMLFDFWITLRQLSLKFKIIFLKLLTLNICKIFENLQNYTLVRHILHMLKPN